MRRGFDGLTADVAEVLHPHSYSGAAFVFRSKRGDYVKIVTWDGSGLLFAKRLEKGRFGVKHLALLSCLGAANVLLNDALASVARLTSVLQYWRSLRFYLETSVERQYACTENYGHSPCRETRE